MNIQKSKLLIAILLIAMITTVSACAAEQPQTSPPVATEVPEIVEEAEPTSIPTEPPPTETPIPTNTPEPTATPEPTFTPTPVSVSLEADGSGDFETLTEAVNSAQEGASIILGAGIFQLEEGVVIDKSLSLVGQGMEETEIVSSAELFVIQITGETSISAEGIAFRHEGSTGANVIQVDSGEVNLSNLRFSGAVFNEAKEIVGAGLILAADASGTVEDCIGENNNIGYVVFANDIQLVGNTALQNVLGMGFGAESQAVAQGNLVTENKKNGIRVVDNAKPFLEENITTANQGNGIQYIENGGGSALNNECTNNGWHGIVALGQSDPTIEGNTCADNAKFGIAIAENATSTVRQNTVTGNKFSGILVSDDAQGTIEENICNQNAKVGIFFRDNSSGSAVRNQCVGNSFGIFIDKSANVELVENDCTENKVADIKDERD
jgi:parallel beta-helix repeat protein